jgi:hypothetical protein
MEVLADRRKEQHMALALGMPLVMHMLHIRQRHIHAPESIFSPAGD